MHNHDDKYPVPSGFEPGTSRLYAPVDMNEPSGPTTLPQTLLGNNILLNSLTQNVYIEGSLINIR